MCGARHERPISDTQTVGLCLSAVIVSVVSETKTAQLLSLDAIAMSVHLTLNATHSWTLTDNINIDAFANLAS